MDAKGRVLSDECIADEVPYEELPEGWVWARLEDCCSVIVDCPHSTPSYLAVETGYSAIDTNCMDDDWHLTGLRSLSQESYEKRTMRYAPQAGDIVFSREGSIGRSVILHEGNICLGQRVMLLSCNEVLLFNRYCQAALSSPYAWKLYRAANIGTGVKHINVSMIKTMLVPVPPLAEQRRIVERVDELMPLVEECGKLEDAREEMDASLPGRLRKSVLQIAVQGKLVPQDPADEPASALLERIRGQRRQLVAEKKMKAPKGGESVVFRGSDGRRYEKRIDAKGRESKPICIEDEIPFEIPDSWEWTRLESVIVLLSGTDLKPSQYNEKNEGIPYLTGASNFTNGELIENRWTIEPSRISNKGELLFTCKGTVGEMAINQFDAAHIARQIMSITPCEYEMLPYIALSLKAMVEDIKSHAKGVIPGIERNTLLARLIPIPPLAEQKRIAGKSAELFGKIA
ncbi:restriction endonuclease subunit S [uncultured Slackia sp.]|uniref:restriction endonuclease subunit S n=1 Tax=uncultured Slackia sp. TaxID=665903 RepID=UPI00258FF9F7|nr:restriction endonuclease subunit S [uncultured Slackia sp.]